MPNQLEQLAATNDQLLQSALERINSRIALLTAQLQAQGDNFVGGTEQLQRALNMRVEIAQVFAQEFAGVQQEVLNSMIDAARNANLSFGSVATAFTATDSAVIDAMMNDTGYEITSASLLSQAQISQEVYMSVLSGTSRQDTLDQIKQYLVGQTDKRGNPMLNHAQTIMRTRLGEVDATVVQMKAQELGIDRFRYTGSLVRDSRQWCKEHLGKVLTREEIEAWREKQWVGKKPGDPFVVRGGWNCTHVFRPYFGD